jgi:hypothetical protein
VRRYRNAIILLAFFIVLLAVVLLTQNNSSSSTTTAAATATPDPKAQQLQILNIPSDDAPTKLEVKQTDPAKSVAFKYENNKWYTDAANPTELDTISVASNVGVLTGLKGTALITDKGDNLQNYGLDKPKLSITMNSPKAGVKTLQIGDQNPATNAYYIKLDNEPKVWTVPASLIDPVKGWLDKLPVLPPTPTPLPTVQFSPLPSPVTGTPGTPGGSTTPGATTSAVTTAASTTTAAATTASATTAPASTPVPTGTP